MAGYKFVSLSYTLLVLWLMNIFHTSHQLNRNSQQNKPKLMKSPRPYQKDAIAIVNEMCRLYMYARYDYEIPVVRSKVPGKANVTRRIKCRTEKTLVLNGANADPMEFPHMALIGYPTDSEETDWKCGGSLISERFILSAAHCVRQGTKYGTPKWARLGDLDYKSETDEATPETFNIIETLIYPEYRRTDYYHDIALFKLNTTVTFNAFIRPTCLHTSHELPLENPKAIVTGWGYHDENSPPDGHLKSGKIPVLESQKCKIHYTSKKEGFSKGYNSTLAICTGDVYNSIDTCQGDSGSPLQIRHKKEICMYTQIGITSVGPRICVFNDFPAVYTRISYYIKWIQGIVWPRRYTE